MATPEPRPLALVTGASSGIGLELAKQFAANGFDLLLNAEDDRLAAAVAALRPTGAQVQAVRADLRTPEGAGGVATKGQAAAAKMLTDRAKAGLHRSMAEPGSADTSAR